ncbi:short-chain dehydrogenase [Acidocella aquatica]|uniref:Short-chain dehydrogenase n=1 Tax=Acidocella aquatica TaxID=1922313 RepID=A0ABQ6A818_9PROT|nr:SDR family oxidoreductase [Acidocella aquatica]GLR67006.1 short-chain dehydrogenase [Acidocella aquatica]
MARLSGKVAFLAGSTSGIGKATAEIFAAEGARVVVSGRRAAEGEAVAQTILDAGGQAIFMRMDVSEPEQVERAVARTVEHFGRLDILFSNAGGSSGADGPLTTGALDEFWNKMRVDLFGTFLCSRFAIPQIIKSGGGSVINMASMVGFGSTRGRDAYSAAKGAVLTLTRSTAREFAAQRVRVNAIAPAAVKTERILKMLETVPDAKSITSAQTLGLIELNEIAYAAVYLGSEEARSITGQILAIHAGLFE